MTAPTVPASLHRKLTEVMAAIDWQPKTQRNSQQGYNFVSVERIKDNVRTQLAERHVMAYTSIDTVTRSEYLTKNQTAMSHIIVQGEVTFADGDSGEMFTVKAAGEASDSGDKALNKAQTALIKYALINTFLIPTGDDPDQETPEPSRPRQTPRPAGGQPASTTEQPKPEPALPSPPPPAETAQNGPLEPKAGMVQCESKSPFGTDEAPVQCRLAMGHTGDHRTQTESW